MSVEGLGSPRANAPNSIIQRVNYGSPSSAQSSIHFTRSRPERFQFEAEAVKEPYFSVVAGNSEPLFDTLSPRNEFLGPHVVKPTRFQGSPRGSRAVAEAAAEVSTAKGYFDFDHPRTTLVVGAPWSAREDFHRWRTAHVYEEVFGKGETDKAAYEELKRRHEQYFCLLLLRGSLTCVHKARAVLSGVEKGSGGDHMFPEDIPEHIRSINQQYDSWDKVLDLRSDIATSSPFVQIPSLKKAWDELNIASSKAVEVMSQRLFAYIRCQVEQVSSGLSSSDMIRDATMESERAASFCDMCNDLEELSRRINGIRVVPQTSIANSLVKIDLVIARAKRMSQYAAATMLAGESVSIDRLEHVLKREEALIEPLLECMVKAPVHLKLKEKRFGMDTAPSASLVPSPRQPKRAPVSLQLYLAQEKVGLGMVEATPEIYRRLYLNIFVLHLRPLVPAVFSPHVPFARHSAKSLANLQRVEPSSALLARSMQYVDYAQVAAMEAPMMSKMGELAISLTKERMRMPLDNHQPETLMTSSMKLAREALDGGFKLMDSWAGLGAEDAARALKIATASIQGWAYPIPGLYPQQVNMEQMCVLHNDLCVLLSFVHGRNLELLSRGHDDVLKDVGAPLLKTIDRITLVLQQKVAEKAKSFWEQKALKGWYSTKNTPKKPTTCMMEAVKMLLDSTAANVQVLCMYSRREILGAVVGGLLEGVHEYLLDKGVRISHQGALQIQVDANYVRRWTSKCKWINADEQQRILSSKVFQRVELIVELLQTRGNKTDPMVRATQHPVVKMPRSEAEAWLMVNDRRSPWNIVRNLFSTKRTKPIGILAAQVPRVVPGRPQTNPTRSDMVRVRPSPRTASPRARRSPQREPARQYSPRRVPKRTQQSPRRQERPSLVAMPDEMAVPENIEGKSPRDSKIDGVLPEPSIEAGASSQLVEDSVVPFDQEVVVKRGVDQNDQNASNLPSKEVAKTTKSQSPSRAKTPMSPKGRSPNSKASPRSPRGQRNPGAKLPLRSPRNPDGIAAPVQG